VVCPPGSYCGHDGREASPCPRGFFCPLGTVEPFKCGTISICPVGSSREFFMDGFVTIILIDLLLVAFSFRLLRRTLRILGRVVPSPRRLNPEKDVEKEPPGALTSSSLDKTTTRASSEPDALREFVDSIKRCVGSHQDGVTFEFSNVSRTLANGKTILSGQNGRFEKCSLWGVMGESGSGKSRSLIHHRPFDCSCGSCAN